MPEGHTPLCYCLRKIHTLIPPPPHLHGSPGAIRNAKWERKYRSPLSRKTNGPTHPQIPAWGAPDGQRMELQEVDRAPGIWGTGHMAMARAGEKKGTGLQWSEGQLSKERPLGGPGIGIQGRKGPGLGGPWRHKKKASPPWPSALSKRAAFMLRVLDV